MTEATPRIQVSLKNDTREILGYIAENNNQSLSAAARELIEMALDLEEDKILSMIADRMVEEDENSKMLNHDDVWK